MLTDELTCFSFEFFYFPGQVEALIEALNQAKATKDKPTAILAKTFKGKYITGIEDTDNWHGKPLGDKAGPAIEVNR
jgi:transketolase